MEQDCCFSSENNWFRYRAGGIVVEDRKVLFVTDNVLDYFYTVGGGVHIGESSEDCVRRELKEELGVDYEIDHMAVVCENFFTGDCGNIEGMDCHCLEFYYLMKSRGIREFENVSINCEGNREHFQWIPIDDIQNYNIKPSFLKDRIRDIVDGHELLHVITYADK